MAAETRRARLRATSRAVVRVTVAWLSGRRRLSLLMVFWIRLVSEDRAESSGVHQSGRMFVGGFGWLLLGREWVAASRVRLITLSRAN